MPLSQTTKYIFYFTAGTNVLSCEFYADGSTIPDNRFAGCRIGLAYPWSRFGAVLDVLGNEKPIYYGFIFSTKLGYIATQSEPVGEEETTTQAGKTCLGGQFPVKRDWHG